MSKRETFRPNWPRLIPSKYTYSPAAKKGGVLCISGQASVDPLTGKVLYPGDIVTQAKQTYENIKAILNAAGATFDDVIKTVDYISPAGLDRYKETAAIRREYFKNEFPAATGIVVNQLLLPGLLIEIDVIAVVD